MATSSEISAVLKLRQEGAEQLKLLQTELKAIARSIKEVRDTPLAVGNLEGALGQIKKLHGEFTVLKSKLADVGNAKVNPDFSSFTGGLQKAKGALSDLASGNIAGAFEGIGTAASGMGLAIGGIAAAAAAAVAVTAKWSSELVATGARLTDLSARTDLSTDAIQKFEYGAKLTGTSLESVIGAAQKMELNLVSGAKGASEALNELGLSQDRLFSMSLEEKVLTIGEALRGVEDPAKRAQLAFELMGRAGRQTLGFFSQDLREVGAELESVGGIIDSETIAAADRLDDAMTRLTTRWQAFKASAIAPVVAALADFLDKSDAVAEAMKKQAQIASGKAPKGAALTEKETLLLEEHRLSAGGTIGDLASNRAQLERVQGELARLKAEESRREEERKLGIKPAIGALPSFKVPTVDMEAMARASKELDKDIVKVSASLAKSTDEAKRFRDAFTTSGAQQQAKELAAQLAAAGGASSLSSAGVKKLAAEIKQLRDAGAELPSVLVEVEMRLKAITSQELIDRSRKLRQEMTQFLKGIKIPPATRMELFTPEEEVASRIKALQSDFAGNIGPLRELDPFEAAAQEAKLNNLNKGVEKVAASTSMWSETLATVANTFTVLGVNAQSGLGRIIGTLTTLLAGTEQFKKGLNALDFSGGKGIAANIEAIKDTAIGAASLIKNALSANQGGIAGLMAGVSAGISGQKNLSGGLDKLSADSTRDEMLGGIAQAGVGGAESIISAFAARKQETGIGRALAGAAAARSGGENLRAGFDRGGAAGAVQMGVGVAQGIGGIAAATDQRTKGKRVAGGALAGAQMGASFGPIGMAVGAGVGALVGLLRHPAWADIANKVGKNMGVNISDALAKEIAKKAKEMKVGKDVATQLSLGKIIGEGLASGSADLGKLSMAMRDTFSFMERGQITSAQANKILGESFGQLGAEIVKTGDHWNKGFIETIELSGKLGLKNKEIGAFLKEQFTGGSAGLAAVFKNAGDAADVTADRLNNLGTIGLSMFATLRAQGMSVTEIIAVLGDSISAAKDAFAKAGIEITGPFKELVALQDLIGANKGLFDAADGLNAVAEALSNTTRPTAELLSALGSEAGKLYDQLTAAGATSDVALRQIAPTLLTILEAHTKWGVAIDDTTKKLIEEAQASGALEQAKGPMDKLLDATERIAAAVEKLAGITHAAAGGFDAMGAAIGALPKDVVINVHTNKTSSGEGAEGDTDQFRYGGLIIPKAAHGMLIADSRSNREMFARVPRAQHGILQPTRAGGQQIMVGEGGGAEVVAPVSALFGRLGEMMAEQVASRVDDGGGVVNNYATTVEVNAANSFFSAADENELAQRIRGAMRVNLTNSPDVQKPVRDIQSGRK